MLKMIRPIVEICLFMKFIDFTNAAWVRIPALDTSGGYYSCGAGAGSTSNVASLADC